VIGDGSLTEFEAQGLAISLEILAASCVIGCVWPIRQADYAHSLISTCSIYYSAPSCPFPTPSYAPFFPSCKPSGKYTLEAETE
jgi:hypothetical protein